MSRREDRSTAVEWTLPDLMALRPPAEPGARAALRAQLTSTWTGEIPVLTALGQLPAPRGRHSAPDDLATVAGTPLDRPTLESVDQPVARRRHREDDSEHVLIAAALASAAGRSRHRHAAGDVHEVSEADDSAPIKIDLGQGDLPVLTLPDVLPELPVPDPLEALWASSADETMDQVRDDTEHEPSANPAPADRQPGNQPIDGVSTPNDDRTLAQRLRKPALVGVAATVCLLTAGAGTVAALGKSVTVTVDGHDRQVTTLAGDVGGALRSAGITVGAHDALAPAGVARIHDGSRISLERGRQLTLVLDGQQRTIWTTARTVEQALEELGDADDQLVLSADRSRTIPLQGMALTGSTVRRVTIKDARGQAVDATTAATVADLLREQKVALGDHDSVRPAAGTPLTDGMLVNITRRMVQRDVEQRSIAQPAPQSVPSDSLEKGHAKVVPGRAGIEQITYQVVSTNGGAAVRSELSRTVLRSAQPTITYVGTKIVRPEDTWSLPWDQMAMCESSGKWDINTGNGTYGGLQFMTSTWLAYGGSEFAERADLATKAQQIVVAERLYAKEGLAPWHCARLLGWGFGQYRG